MRFDAHRKFRRDLTRLRTLYEASTEAYRDLYKKGKTVLKQKSHPHSIEFEVGERIVKRPWREVTYHARDIYPKTLRSIILVQTVSLFEVYITSIMEELSKRSTEWLKDQKRIDKTHAEILKIEEREGFEHYILRKSISNITRGSLEEKRTFFRKRFKIELSSDQSITQELTEIHDRRNIFVHRGGFPDALFIHRYPLTKANERRRLPVTIDYLDRVFIVLEDSAWHINNELDKLYPSPIKPRYSHGQLKLPLKGHLVYHVSVRAFDTTSLESLSAQDLDINSELRLSDILVWSSVEGRKVNFVLCGTGEQIGELVKLVVAKERAGEIEILNSFRINRQKTTV